jgi:triacylglycerol esterase/lipase EstA (alpha/beta hydrolase family)
MLARYLRLVLILQSALGFAVAYAVAANATLALLVAILTPVASPVLAIGLSGVLSKGRSTLSVWLRALVGECWATRVLFVGRQPWSWSDGSVRIAVHEPTAPRVPVLLVHGYLCNHRIWDTMAADLLAHGHTVLAIDLEPVFGSVDHYAHSVERGVQALCAHTGASHVALVGHSMGGLAIRSWMQRWGTARAAGVLTLGTPHAGTRLARVSTSTNGRQMRHRSDWLAALTQNTSAAERDQMQIAITAQDNIVFPQYDQVLAGIAPTVFEGMGHLQMCTDASVIAWVRERLAQMNVSQPQHAQPGAKETAT